MWSNILARRNWSLCLSNKDGENWKARLNSVIVVFVVKNAYGSLYFKYTGYPFRKNGKPCHDQMTRSCEVVEY